MIPFAFVLVVMAVGAWLHRRSRGDLYLIGDAPHGPFCSRCGRIVENEVRCDWCGR